MVAVVVVVVLIASLSLSFFLSVSLSLSLCSLRSQGRLMSAQVIVVPVVFVVVVIYNLGMWLLTSLSAYASILDVARLLSQFRLLDSRLVCIRHIDAW